MSAPASPMLAAALEHASRGLHVLACKPREKLPNTGHGLHDATTDTETITRWWAASLAANVGMAMAASGLVALDVDPRHGGNKTLAEMLSELGVTDSSVASLAPVVAPPRMARPPTAAQCWPDATS